MRYLIRSKICMNGLCLNAIAAKHLILKDVSQARSDFCTSKSSNLVVGGHYARTAPGTTPWPSGAKGYGKHWLVATHWGLPWAFLALMPEYFGPNRTEAFARLRLAPCFEPK